MNNQLTTILEDKDNNDCILVHRGLLRDALDMSFRKGNPISLNCPFQLDAYSVLDNFSEETDFIFVNRRGLENLIKNFNEIQSKNDNNADLISEISNEENFYRGIVPELISAFAKGAINNDDRVNLLVRLFEHERNSVNEYTPTNSGVPTDSDNQSYKNRIALLESEISQKDAELLDLRQQLAHANEELKEFRNEKALRSEKYRQATEVNRQKAIEANKKKGMNTGALILAYHFDGLDIKGIVEVMSDYNCINIEQTLVYRTLSVRKDTDRERILSLFRGYPDYFSCTEEEVIDWFERTRIKKLHLITRDEFIERFGEDKLPDPDKYVSGEYYPRKQEVAK